MKTSNISSYGLLELYLKLIIKEIDCRNCDFEIYQYKSKIVE